MTTSTKFLSLLLPVLVLLITNKSFGMTTPDNQTNDLFLEENILEYSSNTIFQATDDNPQQYFPEFTVLKDENGITYEYNINYAYIREYSKYPGIRFLVPGFESFYLMGIPGLPDICFSASTINLPNEFSDVTCEIIEADYMDLHYKIAAQIPPIPDCISDHYACPECEGVDLYIDITPYKGLYPETLIFKNKIDARTFWIEFYPMQYDYENEIVRAYTHIKYKISYGNMASIDTIDADSADANAEFYNLQGIRVNRDNLTPGCYIVRTAGNAAKVFVGK